MSVKSRSGGVVGGLGIGGVRVGAFDGGGGGGGRQSGKGRLVKGIWR